MVKSILNLFHYESYMANLKCKVKSTCGQSTNYPSFCVGLRFGRIEPFVSGNSVDLQVQEQQMRQRCWFDSNNASEGPTFT